MGVCVGFIQNLIGPRGQRCSWWCECGCEGGLLGWLVGRLAAELKGFIDQVPSCSPDCWGPGCSRGGSDRGRSFWRRARPAKSGRLRYVVCSLRTQLAVAGCSLVLGLVWSVHSMSLRCGTKEKPSGS